MGLDISFNRKAAVAAGLVISKDCNGDAATIAFAKSDPDCDPAYLAWLQREDEFIEVPNAGLFVSSDGFPDSEYLVVRANKWGRVYAPLTQWLQANNITWGEY